MRQVDSVHCDTRAGHRRFDLCPITTQWGVDFVSVTISPNNQNGEQMSSFNTGLIARLRSI